MHKERGCGYWYISKQKDTVVRKTPCICEIMEDTPDIPNSVMDTSCRHQFGLWKGHTWEILESLL